MARIRTVKPEFFTSADICSLSPLARLLYIATWCEADREGRLTWNLRTLKLRYFPEDDCDLRELASELLAVNLVQVYEADGKLLASIPTFASHQHLNPREAASKLPAPPEFDASLTRQARVSDAQGGREGKGRERKGIDPPLPPAVAGGISPLVPVPSDASEQDATGPLLQLEALRATKPKGLTPAGFMDLWSTHSGGTRIGRAPEGKRLAGIKRCLKARPRREDWLPVLAKVKELRALPDTGWLTIDWLVRDVSHADRLVDGAFDWKLTAAAPPKPHRHDGLPRIDAPKPERKPGDRDVLRCADCFEILPHTWTDDGWTPDPHPCAESAMEMP